MADVSNVLIKYGVEDQYNKFHMPVASGTVVAPGDLVLFTTTAATVLAAAADCATFTGVSCDLSRSGDVEPIAVLRRGIVGIPVSAATYTPGLAVTWAAGANGTNWELVGVSTGALGIMWANCYKVVASVSAIDCVFDAFKVGGVAAGEGLWDKLAT
jgi:hypothetical protein